ncbi:hypothetical protein DICVIV_02641 [Dictyocaulus viviparus]|uniref:MICOS complex subunit MIC13 n=1 Tax=Dictyocaulus viviparus TaxID=29172 RepID=A0A0D8Y5C6_DICVI|nr:hypothetical protein DICVIV_02641 [Dictyocaulus viviparus]
MRSVAILHSTYYVEFPIIKHYGQKPPFDVEKSVKTIANQQVFSNKSTYNMFISMGLLWSISKFSIKVALVSGAVKLSIDSDVWSTNNENGAFLYNTIKEYVLPGTVVFRESFPSLDEVKSNVAQYWNNGVDRVFMAFESAPASFRTVVNQVIDNK